MDVQERIRTTVEPLLDGMDVELVDLEVAGAGGSRVVRLSVDREGGVDLETIAEVSRQVSRTLDADDPIAGSYTLEVSSPGVERPLRRPDHFRRVVGERVSAKTHVEVDGARRHEGVLAEVDDEGFTLDLGEPEGERRLRFDEVEKARTVFEWGPAPKPGKGGGKQARKRGATGNDRTKV